MFVVQHLMNKPFVGRLGEMGFRQLPKIIVHKKSDERKLLWLTINL